jgi:hypothetical protein
LKAQGRQHLALVPQTTTDPGQGLRVHFCSHCGARPDSEPAAQSGSRVCDSCGFGLLLEANDNTAPTEGDAFLVLDSSMSVCAVSAQAESLLGAIETGAVNRHVTEIVVPADTEAQGPANLAVAVTWAARGDEEVRTVTVRPTNVFGVRLSARIASCGPPTAALLVFDPR